MSDYTIKIRFGDSLPYFEKNTQTNIFVDKIDAYGITTDITMDSGTVIQSLDKNISITSNVAHFGETGTGIIKVIHTDSGDNVYTTSQEFIVYDTFFRDNYIDHFIPNYEKQLLLSNKKMKIILDTMMEFMDIIYAYNDDAKDIEDYSKVKTKFLNIMGRNIGFERIDHTDENSIMEIVSNEVYRQLLINMMDLLSIKGTKLAYDLFFNVIGYNIEIDEFWYDDDGNLVQLEESKLEDDRYPTDPSNPLSGRLYNTFFRFDMNGVQIDDPQIPVKDPRSKSNSINSVFKNSKTNYIRPYLAQTENGIAKPPGSLNFEQKKILDAYFEFLRPGHVKYLPAVLRQIIKAEPNDPSEFKTYGDSIQEIVSDFTITSFVNWLIGIKYDITSLIPFDKDLFSDNPTDIIDVDSIIAPDDLILGGIREIIDNLYSTAYKYDTGLKYDTGSIKYDSRELFFESFEATRY